MIFFFLGNSGKVWTSPWEMYSLIYTTRHASLNYSPLRSRDIVKRIVKGRLSLCFVGINQWRIQDFPGGRGRQLPKWNFFAHFFAEKMKEFRPRGRPWGPPCQCKCAYYIMATTNCNSFSVTLSNYDMCILLKISNMVQPKF